MTLVGFKGLVGPSESLAGAVSKCPTLGIELGGTQAYIGGLAGPGVLPVSSVELYARAPPTSVVDQAKDLVTGVLVAIFLLIVVTFVANILVKWRRRARKTGGADAPEEPCWHLLCPGDTHAHSKNASNWFKRSFGHTSEAEHKKTYGSVETQHHALGHEHHSLSRMIGSHSHALSLKEGGASSRSAALPSAPPDPRASA